jgi:ADP-ribosylglycohydrolase
MAESLVAKQAFDPVHQLETYVRWYRQGHLSVKGRCFDIGNATRSALERFIRGGEPFCGDSSPHSAGNGSLMRLAPAALGFAGDPAKAIQIAGDSSRTTHAAAECIDSCRYFGALLIATISGRDKSEILHQDAIATMDSFRDPPLTGKVKAIAAGSFKLKKPPEIRGSGYVIHTLEAALWAFHSTDNFRDGALKVVNLGEDADTTGAVYGQIAGAYYGAEGIPAEWREKVAMRDLIERRARELHVMAFGE